MILSNTQALSGLIKGTSLKIGAAFYNVILKTWRITNKPRCSFDGEVILERKCTLTSRIAKLPDKRTENAFSKKSFSKKVWHKIRSVLC